MLLTTFYSILSYIHSTTKVLTKKNLNILKLKESNKLIVNK